MNSRSQQLDQKLEEILDLQIEAWALSRQEGKAAECEAVNRELEKARDEYTKLSHQDRHGS